MYTRSSRSTSYLLGDIREPLEALLTKRNTDIKASAPTLYFFDSESFRYLAADKQLGKEIPGKNDFVASWEKSSEKARRLIETTFSLPTHEVKMTLSLNRTRTFITGMVKPMLEFSNNLQDTEKKCQAKIEEIETFRTDNTKLKDRLVITKTVFEKRPLNKPHTVCGAPECFRFEYDDPTSKKRITVCKSICHNACYVETSQEVQGHPELAECWAFNLEGTDCKKCSRGWKLHLHISYLPSQSRLIEIAAAVKAMVKSNNAKQAAEVLKAELYREVKEFRSEDAQIKRALAEFDIYLRKGVIVAYNDT